MEALQQRFGERAEAHILGIQQRPRYEALANLLDSVWRGSVRGERALREPGAPGKKRKPLLLGESYRGLRLSDRWCALAANAVKPGVMPCRLSDAERVGQLLRETQRCSRVFQRLLGIPEQPQHPCLVAEAARRRIVACVQVDKGMMRLLIVVRYHFVLRMARADASSPANVSKAAR